MSALDTPNPNGAPAKDEPASLVRALLAESRELTAVERFAKAHEEGAPPAQSKHYRDLIPLSKPGEGEQYAFDVDLDACSGCKACVSACHHMNGLEETETWRWVGQLHGPGPQESGGLPIIQHVTTACHHCVDPGCLAGCPTNAYEKDPVTGVVRHLDDQCFGCQYCTMACPYEVPQYSESKGIVRKCDMCHGRLAEGEAPACVQACPNQAIRISVVDVAETVARGEAGEFLPSSPPANLTKPTTRYRGDRPIPVDLKGADFDHAAPQHAHLPLVFMLVLTQASLGGVMFGVLSRWLGGGIGASAAIALGAAACLAGLALAPLHLGRPHLAFRSILGWRHSWLSREAIVFGAYAPLAIGAAAFALLPTVLPVVEPWLPGFAKDLLALLFPSALQPLAELAAIGAGAAGVFCSAKIYEFTGRYFWKDVRTFLKFGGTALVLGPSLLLAVATVAESVTAASATVSPIIVATILLSLTKLAYEASLFRQSQWDEPEDQEEAHMRLTSGLMLGPLRGLTAARFALGLLGGVLLPIGVAVCDVGSTAAAAVAVLGFLSLLAGEFCERALYFAAVIPLRMPGGVRS